LKRKAVNTDSGGINRGNYGNGNSVHDNYVINRRPETLQKALIWSFLGTDPKAIEPAYERTF